VAIYTDIVRWRDLFRNLCHRDFQAKYRGSVLGVVWSLVTPLVLMGVYLVVFGYVNKSTTTKDFPLYLLSGIAFWTFFSITAQVAARSMIDSGSLIRKVRFPRQLVTFSAVATQAITFAVMLVIVITVSLIFAPAARETVWLVIPIAALFLITVTGFSLVAACINVVVRDYEYLQTAALLPWFFLTPILWGGESLAPTAISHGSADHQLLVHVLTWGNFVAPPIVAIHYAVWLGEVPPVSILSYIVVSAIVALAFGSFVFRRIDNRIATEV
jgi:ABC-type polysaccharide/polyol phosphate export permease